MENFQKRIINEHDELVERMIKLKSFLNEDNVKEKVGENQYYLMEKQAKIMQEYVNVLTSRLEDMGIFRGESAE